MAQAAAAKELRLVDPHVWKACAGTAAKIPSVGSRVYYFPQGHAEQSSSTPDFSAVPCRRPFVLCSVSAVRFLANPDSDEVFAQIDLDPRFLPPAAAPPPADIVDGGGGGGGGGGVVSFAKILTPSDANNGGGFSVPRFCADSIFPGLDFKADPPVQTISVRDVHGARWDFRHIYRGTPRRHLLTTGWSKFVNCKKLVAGDSVVFIKNQAGELFVGVRRNGRSCGSLDYLPYSPPAGAGVKLEESLGSGEGFSRNVRGRVPASSVVDAVRLAEMNCPFEVLYYPRSGSPDFVVAEEVVESAMRVYWTAGMRVKMSVDTEDMSRMTWFQGTVSSAALKDVGPWPGSPWRMLQVTWDEPEVLQNVRSVNPWQVELVSAPPQIQTPYPLMKKLRGPQSQDFSDVGEGSMLFPVTGFKSKSMGNLSPLINNNTFPAGMQGARHDQICVPTLFNFIPLNGQQTLSENLYGAKMQQKLNNVSTNSNVGSTLISEGSSPLSNGSILDCGTDLLKTVACNPTRKTRGGSFQLFGQIIQTEQPVDVAADKEYRETTGGVLPHDFSLSYQHKQLLDGLDVQRQRVSALEACSM
ncbi:auxin response factor 17-like [Phoenix dactylifera]|uniref:Auxin response factor n=1 Tax=Phoenix dactylifera TaxID=42345 RepID=A0A8B7BUU8_PHODC|nr:auxin response factor 17-like [Phoenix dactylifera]